jgi:sec-independent protein translocase protein TatC
MSIDDDKLTFWDHLDELRSVLLRILGIALLFGVVAFCLKEILFDVVLAPTSSDFVTYRLFNHFAQYAGSAVEPFSVSLINVSLAQQFMVHIKTAFVVGLLCASPYIIYALLQFIAPALYSSERSYVFGLVGFGYLMFIIGLLLCYFLIFPLTFRFLGTYQVSGEVENLISLDSYISTLTTMSLMLGAVFELPVLCWLLAKFGLLTADFMRGYRKHAIVVILVIAAIITPTSDAFTLALVSLPIWLLYELSIKVVSSTKSFHE